jgi:UDP-N-acetylglucosamine diphosphorylase/glucosamine-1-phosphate N-acetyltransferase
VSNWQLVTVMRDLDLILYDDPIARDWEPFALTRPVGELLFGTMTLRARLESAFRATCSGHLSSDHLADFQEEGAAPVAALDSIATDRPRLFVTARFVPETGSTTHLPSTAGTLVSELGETIGWYAPAGVENPSSDFFLEPGDSEPPIATVAGRLLERVWQLISANPDQVGRDIAAMQQGRVGAALPAGAFHWGKHQLVLDPTAIVEPGAALDTSDGPIWIDRGAHVRAFTRLAGPAYVGPSSTVLGGAVEAVSIGPVCRVRGELAESVCLGYVNKQHDGHIGHAYLGRWVNLGAETTNSDLKNNYGTIRIWSPAGSVDTGEIKMGSLLGDHVKTGIGLLLNTGTVIGAGSNVYGVVMPPTFVPPFSWGTGDQLVEYRLDKFLEVAERSMARRGVELTSSMREQLGQAWQRGRTIFGT